MVIPFLYRYLYQILNARIIFLWLIQPLLEHSAETMDCTVLVYTKSSDCFCPFKSLRSLMWFMWSKSKHHRDIWLQVVWHCALLRPEDFCKTKLILWLSYVFSEDLAFICFCLLFKKHLHTNFKFLNTISTLLINLPPSNFLTGNRSQESSGVAGVVLAQLCVIEPSADQLWDLMAQHGAASYSRGSSARSVNALQWELGSASLVIIGLNTEVLHHWICLCNECWVMKSWIIE